MNISVQDQYAQRWTDVKNMAMIHIIIMRSSVPRERKELVALLAIRAYVFQEIEISRDCPQDPPCC